MGVFRIPFFNELGTPAQQCEEQVLDECLRTYGDPRGVGVSWTLQGYRGIPVRSRLKAARSIQTELEKKELAAIRVGANPLSGVRLYWELEEPTGPQGAWRRHGLYGDPL